MAKDAHGFEYVIVGGGLAGASAVKGIRDLDPDGSILLIGAEKHLPYNRPPLTKGLWFGKDKVADIFVAGRKGYQDRRVELVLETRITELHREERTIVDHLRRHYHYKTLLLATGGTPRRLPIPGGDLPGIVYFRTLDDYERLRGSAREGATAVIVGGGFIGSELAAALSRNGVPTAIVFPEDYVCGRIFSPALGRAVQEEYVRSGVRVLSGDKPVAIETSGAGFRTRTERGVELESDILIAGIGIAPATGLAESAGLAVERSGIRVDEFQRTSDPSIYAAGDNTVFPYMALGKPLHIEHWDHAKNQGRRAGRNMAGAEEPYDYMPDFFSDLYDLSYMAVGEAQSDLRTEDDWERETKKGWVYYYRGDRLNGVMMCNLDGKEILERGRDMVRTGRRGA